MEQEFLQPNVFKTIENSETATIIVPLYCYTKDNTIKELDDMTFRMAMLKVRSYFHKIYIVFVAEKGNVNSSIMNILMGKKLGGNCLGTEVDTLSTMGMYIEEGITFALEKTNSNYFVVFNPWNMLADDSIDMLLERANKQDIDICSGYDVAKEKVSDIEFETYQFNPVREFQSLDTNLFGFKRSVAERMVVDINYQTKKYLDRDLWQLLKTKGITAISSQAVKYFPFNINWEPIEGNAEVEQDKQYFIKKWGYSIED